MKLFAFFILSTFVMTACGKDDTPSDESAKKPISQFYQKEIETLDQAKKLQLQLNKQAEQTQKRMDELNNQ